MKILYISEGLDRSESHYIRLIAAAGREVEVMLPPSEPADELAAASIPVLRIPLSGRVDQASIRLIRERLNRGDIDIVHCLRNNRPISNALIARKDRRIKIVGYRGTIGHLSRWNPGSWMTYMHPKLDCLTCVSDAVRVYMRKMGVPESRLLTLHKGHDPDWYSVDKKVDLEEHGVPPDACVLCIAANIRPVKGVDVLLAAMAQVPAEANVHLLVVGEDRDDRIKPLVEASPVRDRLHFVGYQSNAPEWIAASELFVMPSVSREGLPRAVIEAMSMRIPPIVTRVGGMPELVEDEVSGLVVPALDVRALAGAITRLAKDRELQRMLGEGARARIEGPFSIAHTVEKLLACYEGLMGG